MIIKVVHNGDIRGEMDITSHYEMVGSPLDLPRFITIGSKSVMGHKIESYADQVSEYDIWLEDAIKNQDPTICGELEKIYQKAISGGIILKTRCMPSPYFTHAHVVKRTIEGLV